MQVRTRDRFIIAVDVRFCHTSVMLSDFEGRELALETFTTRAEPQAVVEELAPRIRRMLRVHGVAECEGIGLVVPGMVDRRSGRILNSPQLGWREVDLRGLGGSVQEICEALRETGFTMGDLMMRARAGDLVAVHALQETGRYLGIGLATVVRSLSPACVIVGGEISRAWDLVGVIVDREARERALKDIAAATPIIPASGGDLPRLRGAAALLIARFFAAPKVA